MDWKFWFLDDCGYPSCTNLPPYHDATPAFQRQHYAKGTTYGDYQYRGGSQMERYYEECIPIFFGTSRHYKWACDFINIADEGMGFLISHPEGRPDYWPECCAMGKPFRAPPKDFNKNMNYMGRKSVDGKPYQSFELLMDVEQGPFQYNFWDEPQEYNGETYYVP